jgi:carbamoyltransferase
MIVCGLKLTHDGAIALVEDDRLVFSVEIEKLHNRPRHSPLSDSALIPEILADFGYRIEDVDHWVVDGWDGVTSSRVPFTDGGNVQQLAVAPYVEVDVASSLLQPVTGNTFTIGGTRLNYTSYPHAAGHLASAYATSPFPNERAFVLVWDGGMFPRLYHIGAGGTVDDVEVLFPLVGHAYALAASHFGPFRASGDGGDHDLSVAGKLMAYIALGAVRPEIVSTMSDLFDLHFESPTSARAARYRSDVSGVGSDFEPSLDYVHRYFDDVARLSPPCPDEDVLASFHSFLEDLLADRLDAALTRASAHLPRAAANLSFVGGCALNIKWNSALRRLPTVDQLWVPPFPNDAGSAIGAACAHRSAAGALAALTWQVRLGPDLRPSGVPAGWRTRPCSPAELARLLHETDEPVVFLNGRAELGPRALGGRSIIAAATSPTMKARLNDVKRREIYRPIAPICLESRAPDVFSPGTPDPFMLFDHEVRTAWRERIPAVLHFDGTARLQTVNERDPVLFEVLREYAAVSGIPVLCNTSANLNGSGFFPDVASAADWGGVKLIWTDGLLYEKDNY